MSTPEPTPELASRLPARPRRRWPRPDTLLLLLGMGWTLLAKAMVVREQSPGRILGGLAEAAGPDVVFFAAAYAVLAGLRLLPWPRAMARVCLLAATLVVGWSVANAAWLVAVKIQLQPGVLRLLLADPGQFGPIVQAHMKKNPVIAVPIVLTLLGGGAWLVWRAIRPVIDDRAMARRALLGVLAFALCGGGLWWKQREGQAAYSGEVIGFSSHWYALRQFVSDVAGPDIEAPARVLPRAGERSVELPADGPRPNIVIVMLESVSQDASSFEPVARGTTPYFERVAADGVRFDRTYVPIPQTSKAFWATLTGSHCDIQSDYAEAVPLDAGSYEALPTILRRAGYRSGFFQMSKGTFECAPGMFANLGFDWAWFLENLEDESAHVGYLSGDDFRALDPMFAWADASPEPFLLGVITTIAHDPYELPAGYSVPEDFDVGDAEGDLAAYLRTIRYTDDFLAELDARLTARGLRENTILCVLGDHGDGFRPESRQGRWAPFEEVLRVPWAVRWPGHIEPGGVVTDTVSQLDVTPTLLALLGANLDDAGFDGIDALAPAPAPRRHYFSSWYRNSPVGYIEGMTKRVYWPYTDRLFEFDLDADPGESRPQRVTGPVLDETVRAVRAWEQASRILIPARRFRERTVFRHWRTFCSGRAAWAVYDPNPDPETAP